MKPLAVEAKETFQHGFILNEGELRRTVDLIREQVKKLPDYGTFEETFTLKFKNGAIAETDSIDEVLQQENSGSGLIVRLRYELASSSAGPEYNCSFEFINADLDEESGSTSIKVAVRASDRDWVFVTSSQLRERVDKIKRFALNQLGSRGGPGSIFLRLLFPFLLLVLTLGMFFFIVNFDESDLGSKRLREVVAQEKIRDPIEAIIRLEEIREEQLRKLDPISGFPLKLLLIAGGMIASLAFVAWVLARYYLVYNFCWGDYIEFFQRREKARSFWLVVIGVGILVSFLGGVLANQMKVF